jgi:hypothetical protein
MGYPVNKDLNYINPRELDHIMQNFLVAEQVRMLSSVSHVDAIESTNIGTDWYQRYASRGDGGQLV